MKLQSKALAIGILGLSGTVFAAGNTTAKNAAMKGHANSTTTGIPVHVGDNVVNQVQDLRRNVSDLVAELKDAVDNYFR